MKKALVLFSLALCILCFTSCEESSKDGLPTTVDIFLNPSEDFYFVVDYCKEHDAESSEMYVNLICQNKLESLLLNGTLIHTDYFAYDANMKYYSYSFDLDGELIGDYDQELNYQIQFVNKTVSGTLRMPSEYICTPPAFEHDQDYFVEWTLQQNPQAQSIDFSLDIDDNNSATFLPELKPDQRNCTLNKTDWNNLGTLNAGRFWLMASNYRYTNGGLVWFASEFRYDEHYFRNHHQNRKNPIERLLSGEIVLPKSASNALID
jgi:hypothetical protein